ncbi:MAG: phenylacetate-CoA oxygenase subunit PaaC [Planctomycetes bacterium]|nr:phenylacetate-CoA oxygenase subunit PaaC [Planctomycetota bacterium]
MPDGASQLTTPADFAFAGYLARLADSHLVLGHRLSEWCGHGPVLEEDLALTNLALDCLGHATVLLRLLGQADGTGRDEDQLAYFREAVEFRNVLLVEQPNGDFARTIARVFLFAAYALPLYEQLQRSTDAALAAAATKFHPELRYHLRHAARWMLILGDGTDESHRRLQEAIDAWWPYTGELFALWPDDPALIERGLIPHPDRVRAAWEATITEVLGQARLARPVAGMHMLLGGPIGRHTETLGYLLAEMQIVARSFPGASW